MSIIPAVVLGLLQGAAEFLPVSSSGHLVLARALMGLEDVPVLFDVMLHLATLAVVLWVFRRRIAGILGAFMRALRRRGREDDGALLGLALRLVTASAVTAVLGLAADGLSFKNAPAVVGLCLIITAVVLLFTRRGGAGGAGRIGETEGIKRIDMRHSFILGTAQGLGVLPGISRSGITIGTGLLLGLDRKTAGEFSFLLSIPAVLGAFLFSLKDAAELIPAVPPASAAAGFLAALVSGYASLKLLRMLVNSGRIWVFSVYLFPVGVWALAWFGGFWG